MAVDVKVAQPLEYYRTFLEQEVRPDGRELTQVRPTTLNVGSITTADGSALVKLGNTTVMCGIKAELAPPKAERPKKGYIVPNVELPPLCSGRFRPGPPSEQAQVASQFLDNVLCNSGCVELEDLCIKEGKLVWVLYCDTVCLDYDGNIIDACLIAIVAALKTVLLPKVTLEDDLADPEVDLSTKHIVKVNHVPVASTFAIFDDSIVFADPTEEEESLASGGLTIVIKGDGELCMVHKPGGSKLEDHKMQDCLNLAKKRCKEVHSLIDTTLLTEVVQR